MIHYMERNLSIFAAVLASAVLASSCSGNKGLEITVENDSSLSRTYETVELDFSALESGVEGLTADNAIVIDSAGNQVPVQVYTERYGLEKLVFQASVPAGRTVSYTVTTGERMPFDTLAYSRCVPERADDYAYENNLVAGRFYGPSLPYPRTFGPDIWLKCTDSLVIDKWYAKGDCHHSCSDGMDCYKVASTLGAGALAPYVGDKIIVGDNYTSCMTLCSGPVRTKAVLVYGTFDVDGIPMTAVREITLDANTRFLKTSTWIDAPSGNDIPVVLGAVLHDVISRTDGEHFIAFTEKASDSADPEADGNISVGLVMDPRIEDVYCDTIDGHAVIKAMATVGKRFDVWTGSGWSHGGISSPEAWSRTVADFEYALAHPLKVTVGK